MKIVKGVVDFLRTVYKCHRDGIDIADLYKKAFHDPLTGAYNRNYLKEVFGENGDKRKRKEHFTIYFIFEWGYCYDKKYLIRYFLSFGQRP